MKLKHLLLLTVFLAIETLHAQDLHFSLFNMSPLSLNPAQTGAFEGTARIGGIYRDQWGLGFLKNQFTTPAIYIDAPIIRGFRQRDWVGVGLLLVQDEAGSARLQTNVSALSASYHLALNKKGTSVLTLGIQGGSTQRKANLKGTAQGANEDITFEEEIPIELGGGGLALGSSQDRTGDRSASFLDFAVGLMLRTQVADNTPLEVGITAGHVNTPQYALASAGGTTGIKRPMRLSAHGRVELPVNEKWSATPTFLWQNTAKTNEIAIQGWANYKLNTDFTLKGGLGYRVKDAGKVLLGADWKDLRVALAYDLNLSSNPAEVYQGGFEIAAWYILKIFKKPTLKPAILCPRF
ncbi:MAG: PorP/SprF family type IX secretion system membrane protein [Saprospiraceae bacterium]|nr:PorP/SprF family type IX secretion system membrane protein [Saprospiraceae bacterium]